MQVGIGIALTVVLLFCTVNCHPARRIMLTGIRRPRPQGQPLKPSKTRRRKVLRAGLNVLMAIGEGVLEEEGQRNDVAAAAAE